jgi:hypothetical protein
MASPGMTFRRLTNIEDKANGIEENRHQGREKTGVSDLILLKTGIMGVCELCVEK